MRVTAIIVNYYSAHLLPPLLNVLQREELISEIIIAGNSQEPLLADSLKKYAKARVLTFHENKGFASAVNIAANSTYSDWWLLLNPDMLPDHCFAEKLLSGAAKTNALIAGPRFYWDEKKTFRLPPAPGNSMWLQHAMEASDRSLADARLFSFYWSIRHEKFWNEIDCFYEPFLSGACLLIRNDKAFFKDGKIFDERFFLYYEDTDLCLQALMQNKMVACVPDAEVVHYWNQSPTQNKGKFMAESHEKFFEKHYGDNYKTTKGFDFTGAGLSGITAEIDFGTVTESPVFQYKTQPKLINCFFELGLNPFFVPFAQADLTSQRFQIPEKIWDKLKPGQYFGRIRNSLNTTLKTWKWEVQ